MGRAFGLSRRGNFPHLTNHSANLPFSVDNDIATSRPAPSAVFAYSTVCSQ